MNPLLVSLGFILGQTIGALIVLMSLKMLKEGFKPDAFLDKDLGQILIGIIVLLMGAYIVLFTLIFVLFDDFNKLQLTYSWTLIVSIALIYFLYFYFPKTKFYKSNFKIRKKPPKISSKPKDETPSLFTWIQAVTSDIVMFIFVGALLLGFVYLLVKVVKYFWYV